MNNKYIKFGSVLLVSAYFWNYALHYTEWHFIDSVDLIFHEAGHVIFSFFGEFIHILMGSGFQILLPLAIALYFFYKKQKISGSLTLFWVGVNLLNVSLYAGDAIAMQLPLLGGDSVIHDWNALLTMTDLLKYTYTIAHIFYYLGLATIFAATVGSLYYVWNRE